jgi:predicted HicB family RNase H-like nuclease
MKKDTQMQIKISSELKKQAVAAAEKDGRNLSNWILKLVQDALKEGLK